MNMTTHWCVPCSTPGLPLQEYKDASFALIRWGITGHRWSYANEYINKINEVHSVVEVQEKVDTPPSNAWWSTTDDAQHIMENLAKNPAITCIDVMPVFSS